jgi:methylmalonyl-CoA mutase cobalamin-binding subunit
VNEAIQSFQAAVRGLAEQWQAEGLPSRQGLDESAAKLRSLRRQLRVPGIRERPPCMVTATLDDGLGQGLAVIENYSESIGMRLVSLGLMQTPDVVVAACCKHQPDYLGLTVLQYDTEEALIEISNRLPAATRIIAGGPVFVGDPDFAARTGIDIVARSVADFLLIMLDAADFAI